MLYDNGCNMGVHVPWKEVEGRVTLPLVRPTSAKQAARDAAAALVAKAKSKGHRKTTASEEMLGSLVLFPVFGFHFFFKWCFHFSQLFIWFSQLLFQIHISIFLSSGQGHHR